MPAAQNTQSQQQQQDSLPSLYMLFCWRSKTPAHVLQRCQLMLDPPCVCLPFTLRVCMFSWANSRAVTGCVCSGHSVRILIPIPGQVIRPTGCVCSTALAVLASVDPRPRLQCQLLLIQRWWANECIMRLWQIADCKSNLWILIRWRLVCRM